MSSELALMADDGSDFRLLTQNFFFDGVHSFSTASGKIAYQQKNDRGKTSIWTINEDGTGQSAVAAPESGWVGDPNFATVPQWRQNNPLEMSVRAGSPGEPAVITVSNPSGNEVDAVLSAFPGLDLELSATGGLRPDIPKNTGTTRERQAGKADPELVWNLSLMPGETSDIAFLAAPRPTVARADEAILFLTLAVPGAPPRMYWQDLG